MATIRGRTSVLHFLLLLGILLFFTAATASSREHDKRGDWRRGEGSVDEREQEEEFRPYVFGRRSFRRAARRSEHGSIRALPPFHEASRLLRGDLRDYRVAVLEASPRAFVVPSHADAHAIGYVAQGEGVMTTIQNGERRSHVVREGHVFVAPAGAVTYLANTDGRRKLVVVKILRTVSSVPGHYQYFFGAGGRNPESVVSGFSESVQRAAFKTLTDRLQKLFGRQDKGVIVRATEQQISELRRRASEGSGHGQHWPLPPFGESHGPYNLKDQRPRTANRHGQLYEADARSFRDLAEHDVRVSLVNISAGSMTAPFYNTRSIKIAYVVEGEGHVEIVCPHLAHGGEREREHERGSRKGRSERGKGSSRREQEGSEESEEKEEAGQGYQTVRARLSRGTAFVVPIGHPSVQVASRDGNLQVVCFEVRAERNERVYLAGPDGVLRKLDGTAKELAFAASEREVDEVLDAQRDKGFLQGPQREESGGEREREEEERRRGRRHEELAETLLRMATGRL